MTISLRIEPSNRGGFNVVSSRGLEVGNLDTYAAAESWIRENRHDWPPNWRRLKEGGK